MNLRQATKAWRSIRLAARDRGATCASAARLLGGELGLPLHPVGGVDILRGDAAGLAGHGDHRAQAVGVIVFPAHRGTGRRIDGGCRCRLVRRRPVYGEVRAQSESGAHPQLFENILMKIKKILSDPQVLRFQTRMGIYSSLCQSGPKDHLMILYTGPLEKSSQLQLTLYHHYTFSRQNQL